MKGEQAEYAESICWTRSTWYLVDDEENGKELKPEDDEGAMRNMIYYSSQTDQNGYYQTGYVGPHTKVSRVGWDRSPIHYALYTDENEYFETGYVYG